MLLFEYPRRECLYSVAFKNIHSSLHYDRAVTELFVDYVDGAPRYLDAVLERLALGIDARESRKQ